MTALPSQDSPRRALRVLGLAGSTRRESFNKQLVRCALDRLQTLGAEPVFLDLADYRMPLYDGDLEAAEGVPAEARALALAIADSDVLLISTPEYNGAVPALLKNSFDWMTRLPAPLNDTHTISGLKLLSGRPLQLLSASPGPLGGMRSLMLARLMFAHLGLWVLPGSLSLGSAATAFDTHGQLADERRARQLDDVLGAMLAACSMSSS